MGSRSTSARKMAQGDLSEQSVLGITTIHFEENSWSLISSVQGRDHIWRRGSWGVKQACLSGWQCGGKDFQVFLLSWKSAKSYYERYRGGFKEGAATLKGAQGDVFSFTYSQDVMAGPSRSHRACIFKCADINAFELVWIMCLERRRQWYLSGTPGPLAAGRRQPMWWGWNRAGELRFGATLWLSRNQEKLSHQVSEDGNREERCWKDGLLDGPATVEVASTRLCDISLLSNFCWGSQWGSARVQLQARGEQNF